MADLSGVVKAYDVRGLVPEQIDERRSSPRRRVRRRWSRSCRERAASGIVVGHDMRPSSPALSRAFADGVAAAGRRRHHDRALLDRRPVLRQRPAWTAPGAMFTASHNPAQYNGIKLCRAGARPVGADTGLTDVRARGRALPGDRRSPPVPSARARIDGAGPARGVRGPPALARRPDRDPAVEGRRGRRQRDGRAHRTGGARHAAGLPALPLDVVPLYFELDGTFPNHEANPLDPANLVDLQAAVLAHARMSAWPSTATPTAASSSTSGAAGQPQRGDRPWWRAARSRASWPPAGAPTVLYNLISSAAVPELIARGRRRRRAHPGRALLHQGARWPPTGAVFGGEHSGHYYFRDFWNADTGHARRAARPGRAGRAARTAEPARRGIRAVRRLAARSTPASSDMPAALAAVARWPTRG